ncbi:FxsA family protein [Ornithinimicrobium cryptoxanthini]|uniref:FxsA family protein n=1 Tax=Ornithinimicrobium cryptoxanthini TaxID=2934161 RepID=A0ABY4YE11_9MICO|nr:FxsA family protein [Ornithinimicrobium cryptoxanthini]USQ74790.1 FxsA family protein [Ornithinimicrobium cryptoxanthini]
MARTDGLSGPIRPDDSGSGSGPGAAGSGRTGSAGGGGPSGRRRVSSTRPGRRRAPRRLRLIFAGVMLLVLLEIVVLIAVGQAIGPWWTIGLLLLFVVIGSVLVRRESSRTWRALRTAVDTGRMPGRELADASLILVGGLLLLLPGFVSDLLGIFLILPFTRGVSRRLLQVVLGARVATVLPGTMPGAGGARSRSGAGTGSGPGSRGPGGSDVIEGEIVSEDPPPRE